MGASGGDTGVAGGDTGGSGGVGVCRAGTGGFGDTGGVGTDTGGSGTDTGGSGTDTGGSGTDPGGSGTDPGGFGGDTLGGVFEGAGTGGREEASGCCPDADGAEGALPPAVPAKESAGPTLLPPLRPAAVRAPAAHERAINPCLGPLVLTSPEGVRS